MSKHSLISSLLLYYIMALLPSYLFAAQTKDEVDVESVKAPPRDVKDILQILSHTRQDQSLIDKVKKCLPNRHHQQMMQIL